jgi:SynChlorMet cassette radical SAM/SPASM protein ScmE
MALTTQSPYAVRIEATRKCNLRCVHCLVAAAASRRDDELSTREWLDVFAELRRTRVFEVAVSGGEPLVRPDLPILLEALSADRWCHVSLLTNGTLLSSEWASRLAALRIRSVFVSLDGLSPGNDRMRGAGAFDAAVAGIERLLHVDIRPTVQCTPTRENLEELSGLIDFIVNLGITSLTLNTVVPEGRCYPVYKRLALSYPDDVRRVASVIDEKRGRYPDLRIDCGLTFHFNIRQNARPTPDRPPKHAMHGCSACAGSCVITATGEVVPCIGLEDFSGGNVRQRPFIDTWRHAEMFARLRRIRSLPSTAIRGCEECGFAPKCDGGCRAAAYLECGDIMGPNPHCPDATRRAL